MQPYSTQLYSPYLLFFCSTTLYIQAERKMLRPYCSAGGLCFDAQKKTLARVGGAATLLHMRDSSSSFGNPLGLRGERAALSLSLYFFLLMEPGYCCDPAPQQFPPYFHEPKFRSRERTRAPAIDCCCWAALWFSLRPGADVLLCASEVLSCLFV